MTFNCSWNPSVDEKAPWKMITTAHVNGLIYRVRVSEDAYEKYGEARCRANALEKIERNPEHGRKHDDPVIVLSSDF